MADMKTDLLIITALESELKRDVLPSGVEIVYSGLGKINAALTSLKAIDQFNFLLCNTNKVLKRGSNLGMRSIVVP